MGKCCWFFWWTNLVAQVACTKLCVCLILIYFHNNIDDKKKSGKSNNKQKHAKLDHPVPLMSAHHQLKTRWKISFFSGINHLDQDGSVGKEREENNADHGETPNLQGGESYKRKQFFASFVSSENIWPGSPPLALGVSLITPLKIPI